MKTLQSLTAISTYGPELPVMGPLQVLALEPTPGFLVKVALRPEGLTISQNQTAVFIPAAELLTLAQIHEPLLTPIPERPAAQPPIENQKAKIEN